MKEIGYFIAKVKSKLSKNEKESILPKIRHENRGGVYNMLQPNDYRTIPS